jgi:hypothetical protein
VHDASKEATRGLFGRLAGKAREWDDIVRMYERDNIHLAEAQMTMNQLVDYDVPHHKSHAQRRGKQLADLERRESEHRRAAVVAADTVHRDVHRRRRVTARRDCARGAKDSRKRWIVGCRIG